MSALARAVALAAALPAAALAQLDAATLESCRTLAEAEAKKAGPPSAAVRLDRDAALHIERRSRRLGSQAVDAVASGHGAIVYPESVPVEISFVCLAGADGRALFFHWLPRAGAPALAQCRRTADPGRCLDALLAAAEQELTPLYAKHLVNARQAGAGADAERAFRASADAFLAYRDAECARRGAAGSLVHKACLVELTRRRALDLQ